MTLEEVMLEMGRSIRYMRKMDEGFHRCLVEPPIEDKVFVLTYFETHQNQFSFQNVREFETELADVKSQELWLCRVDCDGGLFYNRLTVKIPNIMGVNVKE